VFAGAAREAVFSNQEVIERIKKEFIPVSLKAGQVANPPDSLEGRLYRELKRTAPAPQGICVANSAGKVLSWALSFDDQASIAKFLDHGVRRFEEHPDAAEPVPAERYRSFPGVRLPDVTDNGVAINIPGAKDPAEGCPALESYRAGTLLGRVVGRALDAEGRPLPRAASQEHYVEDRFEIPPEAAGAMRAAIRKAEGKEFALPALIGEALVGNAYLGQLDVNPLGGRAVGGQTTKREIALRAVPMDGEGGMVRIEGTSSVTGRESRDGGRGDGRKWEHDIELRWKGFVEWNDQGLSRVVATASGRERLRWGNPRHFPQGVAEVRHLMAGRAIEFEGKVRYGIIATPAPENLVSETPASVAEDPFMRHLDRHLENLLGPGRADIFRPDGLEGLGVTRDQALQLNALRTSLAGELREFVRGMEKLDGPARRDKMKSFRAKVAGKIEAAAKEILTPEQRKKLEGKR